LDRYAIKAAINRNGSSQADIALELGVTPTSVCLVVKGNSRSNRIEQRISEITGFSRTKLWPQWPVPTQQSVA